MSARGKYSGGAGFGLGTPRVNQAPDIPGNPFRGADAPAQAYRQLERFHGVDPHTAGNRLHALKRKGGLGGADDVVIGRTGDVYNARTQECLGSLTNKALGGAR